MMTRRRSSLLILVFSLSGWGLLLSAWLPPTDGRRAEALAAPAVPVTDHPRLWLTTADLPRLRSWAAASNPLYQNGLAVLAAQAKADMDAGRVPGLDQDNGGFTYVDYPAEMYAELFAFMSLIENDPAVRDDYAQRARTLLMYVMDRAVQGAAAGQPYRDPEFSINDRSRWHGEGFALTVDWIYPYLTSADKATIRTVFLRWITECLNGAVTGHDHPEPVGVINDPVLTADTVQVRWSGNNYFTAHMRNIGLMAMALDPADDPGNMLRTYLGNATGAWLYIVDYLMHHDSWGGLLPEGFEYGPQTAGYVTQFLFALHTAGQDDPAAWGPQVVLASNPFWDDLVSAYFHSLSPATTTSPSLMEAVYLPAWYGDGQNYWAPDFIGVFGPLGLYDAATGNLARLQTLRWIETNMPPGGAAMLTDRVRDGNFFVNAVLYFMLFDPAAPAPADPRPSRQTTFIASGLGRILARTGWDTNATWFTYKLSWNLIDHQNGDGNQFEFYRGGQWLTRERTGYDLDYGASDDHNTLALKNNVPDHNDPGTYRNIQWLRGSQWTYVASGDPQLLAYDDTPGFVYALGDATNLYNSSSENATDILHASRSILWLKPDHIVVYDRATSQTAGRFKRFWLNLPAQPVIAGNRATMTLSGQKLFVTTLLPAGGVFSSTAATVSAGTVANDDSMLFQLSVEAPGDPQDVRFLHVLHGADSTASADPVMLVQSSGGTPFAGALVKNTAVLFPVTLGIPFASLTYTVPATTTAHLITGLTPFSGYSVVTQTISGTVQVTLTPNASSPPPYCADGGGVLAWTSIQACRRVYLALIQK